MAPISSARYWRFRLPLLDRVDAAHGALAWRQGLVVLLEDTSGRVGAGEASPLPSYGGGSVAEAAAALDQLLPGVVGLEPAKAWAAVIPLAGVAAGSAAAARCGLETAIADLAAQAAGVTMAAWLRGSDGSLAAVEVNAVLTAKGAVEAAADARKYVERGFRTLKLKVGTEHLRDLERVTAVRAAVGSEVALRVDANGAWEPVHAASRLHDYDGLSVAICEQPIAAGHPRVLDELRRLRGLTGVLIAADESCTSLETVRSVVAAGAADAIVVKPMISGLREALRMAELAALHGLPVIVTTSFDADFGCAAALHLAAAVAVPGLACGLATLDLIGGRLAIGNPELSAGVMKLPPGPGLGVRPDPSALERWGEAGPVYTGAVRGPAPEIGVGNDG